MSGVLSNLYRYQADRTDTVKILRLTLILTRTKPIGGRILVHTRSQLDYVSIAVSNN